MTELKIPPEFRENKAGLVPCSGCGKHLDPELASTYRKVTGWEHPRYAGGTNALAMPERHDEWRCRACIDRLRAGLSDEQESLL